MAVNTISAPISTLKAPTSWGSRTAIKGQLAKIWKDFGWLWKYKKFNASQRFLHEGSVRK